MTIGSGPNRRGGGRGGDAGGGAKLGGEGQGAGVPVDVGVVACKPGKP